MTAAEAIGYALFAAKEIGLTKKQMQQLDEEMRKQVDLKTEEEALEYYYYYHDESYFD